MHILLITPMFHIILHCLSFYFSLYLVACIKFIFKDLKQGCQNLKKEHMAELVLQSLLADAGLF